MGEVFAGRYELLDSLGEGGMGTVWRAHDRKRDQVVAVKVLRQADAGSLMRFMREQALRIDHTHVLTPLGWAGEDDRVLFAMPVVTGGSVATLVGDYGALPPRYAAELLRQLLEGLAAVHAQRVVHRDVKPANLLLAATGTGRPHLLLSDFGIAVPQDEPRLTRPSMVIGTPGYLAPEQLWGADPDPRADLYAAGLVAAEMLTGERPALGPGGLAVVPRLPPGTPRELARLVGDLTAAEAGDRPRSAQAALDRLRGPDLAWPAEGQDAIEVFDHVADPSAGMPGVPVVAVDPAHPDEDRTRSRSATPRVATGAVPTTVSLSSPTEPVAGPTVEVAAPTTPRTLPVTRPAPTAPTADDGAGTGGPARRRAPRTALAMFAAAAVVLVATLLLVLRPGSGPGDAGVTPPAGAPTVGDPCLFSDVGLAEVARDGGTTVCRRDGDAYRWQR